MERSLDCHPECHVINQKQDIPHEGYQVNDKPRKYYGSRSTFDILRYTLPSSTYSPGAQEDSSYIVHKQCCHPECHVINQKQHSRHEGYQTEFKSNYSVRSAIITGLTDMRKTYYIYMLSNNSKMLYIGVTNDLERRVYEHKKKLKKGYTQKYNLYKLVYYEETDDIGYAIQREKQMKGWKRYKKVTLIEEENPGWNDLAEEWYS